MRISLGYTFVSLLLALALTNQAFAAVYRPVNDDSSDESCEDPKSEVQCRLKSADDPGCYLELVPNHGWMRRSCPEGTLFSERDCGCSVSLPQQDQGDSDCSSEEENGKAAPVPCTRKPTHDRRSYLQFVEGKGWNRLPCPDGTAYSAEDCSCTLFLSDDSSSSEENIWGKAVAKVCNREAEDDSHFYMEMVQGHGWIRRACAKGTMFDARTCRCSASEDGSSDSSCEDDDSASEEWDGHCLLKAASSQNNFLQFVEGHGWMTRHCPKGTAFNVGDCCCTVIVSSDESSSSEEDSWRYQSYGKSQRVQSGYDDSSSSSSSSEEDGNYWGHQTYGKGLSVPEGYGDSNNEEDGRFWNTGKGDVPCTRKPTDDKTSYFQFIEGKGWKTQPCPQGTAYSTVDCACSVTVAHGVNGDSSSSSSEEDGHSWDQQTYGNNEEDGDSCNDEPVTCTRKPTHDRRSYLQFIEGKGWKRQPCPQGTAYSADDCACSVTVAHGDNDDSNKKDIHSWSQQSYGKVSAASSGFDDSSSSSEEDGHPWSHHGKGIKIPAGYGDSSSEEDRSSWNTANYRKVAVPCTRKPTHDKSSYLQFIEGMGWISRPCPQGTMYSANDCACSIAVAHGDSDDGSSSKKVIHSWSQRSYGKVSAASSGFDDSSSSSSSSSEEDGHPWSHHGKGIKIPAGYGESSSEEDGSSWNTANYRKVAAPCTRKPTHDKSSYLQFIEGMGWISRPCPQGTMYSANDCACSIAVAHGGSDDSSSSEEHDHSWNQQIYGKSSITRSGYDDRNNGEYGNSWNQQTSGKDHISPSAYDDSSSSSSSSEENNEDNLKPESHLCMRKPSSDSKSYLEFVEGHGWILRPCAEGTSYSATDCACTISLPQEHANHDDSSSEENEDCEISKQETCTREPTDDPQIYLNLVPGHGWVRQACAKGTIFDADTCRCSVTVPVEEVSDSSSEDNTEAEPWNGPCPLKPGNDIKHFLTFSEGHGWMTQPCPRGTGFSADDCGCTVSIPDDDSDSVGYGNDYSYENGYGDLYNGGSLNYGQSEYSPPVVAEQIPDFGHATNNFGNDQAHAGHAHANMAHIFGQALQGQ